MQTPYEILGVGIDASDAEIKQAYLQQVKNNPPDHNQPQFQLIHDAYSAIRDHKSRVSYDLFTLPRTDFNNLIDVALQTEQTPTPDWESLKKILSITVDDASLLNALVSPEK